LLTIFVQEFNPTSCCIQFSSLCTSTSSLLQRLYYFFNFSYSENRFVVTWQEKAPRLQSTQVDCDVTHNL